MINTVPIGEVAFIAMGSAPPGNTYNDTGVGLPMIAGAGDYGAKYPEPKKWTTAPSRVTEIGDLIVCVRATIGDLNWADRKYCLGRGVAGLRAKKDKLDIGFAAHYLNAKKKDLAKLGTGSTFLAIRRADLEEFPIPLPPLAEQKRLAAILDKADAIRRKRQQTIKLAADFLRATFLDMFGAPITNPKGWPFSTIRDLVSDVKYGTSIKADANHGKYPMLRMNNITYQGSLDVTNLKYVDLDKKDEQKYLARRGDILFNRTNSKELVGKTAVYDLDEKMAIAGYLIRVTTNEKSNPYYISAYLNSDHGKSTLRSMCKSIIGMANINAQELQEIKILVPPISLQNKYAELTEAIKRKSVPLSKALAQSQELMNSLTQRAFRGEL
jgi:type I restriction enzyme S subunit